MTVVDVITREALVAWTKGAVPADDTATLVVEAVNAYVMTLPVAARVVTSTDPDTGVETVTVPASLKLGALMLASRTHRRRSSPSGIEAITGESVAYVARYDPEVARFLELDRPRVG